MYDMYVFPIVYIIPKTYVLGWDLESISLKHNIY